MFHIPAIGVPSSVDDFKWTNAMHVVMNMTGYEADQIVEFNMLQQKELSEYQLQLFLAQVKTTARPPKYSRGMYEWIPLKTVRGLVSSLVYSALFSAEPWLKNPNSKSNTKLSYHVPAKEAPLVPKPAISSQTLEKRDNVSPAKDKAPLVVETAISYQTLQRGDNVSPPRHEALVVVPETAISKPNSKLKDLWESFSDMVLLFIAYIFCKNDCDTLINNK